MKDLTNQPWTRKHDQPGVPHVPQAPRVVYPENLEDLRTICSDPAFGPSLRAVGSHWALSRAAVSDHTFIETSALTRTLPEVLRHCLTDATLDLMSSRTADPFDVQHTSTGRVEFLHHVEAGKRVFQLYSELDFGFSPGDGSLADRLANDFGNSSYYGPWAMHTLGGAGGQTIVGALNTGTHGGDFRIPPIADAVAAIHLVADGGQDYWIEPFESSFGSHLADPDRLRDLYGAQLEVVRDDDLFNSVLVSAGRFGIIYSVVLKAVRQYSLNEKRQLLDWEDVKGLLGSTGFPFDRKFAQIAINPSAHGSFTRHRAAVTRRWNVPAAINPITGDPIGRAERRGDLDPTTGTFSHAGNGINFTPHPDRPWEAQPASFLERVCENADFLVGVLQEIADELQEFVDSGGQVVGGTAVAAVAAAAGGAALGSAALITTAAFLAAIAVLVAIVVGLVAAIKALVDAAAAGAGDMMPRLGSTMDEARRAVLNPANGEAGVFVWQMIAYKVFESQQSDHEFAAISYAVMDIHNYLDRSCSAHGDSIEVFFDSTDSRLVAFVDAVLAYESMQQVNHGRACVGYISLRFTGPTSALLGMQRWPRTCAVEIAGLLDVEGSKHLIDFAIARSRNPNVGGILHWGQRMEGGAEDIEFRFGRSAVPALNDLDRWRTQLGIITNGGSHDRFSTDFTRQFGLEI